MYMYILTIILFLILILFNIIYINKKENFDNKNIVFKKPKNWNNLKYTNKLKLYCNKLNEQYALYADKYRVKEYIKSLNIKNLYVPKLIKKLDKNNYILNLNNLPDSCVIKTNNGSGDVIIIKNKQIKLMLKRGIKIEPKLNNYKNWLNTCIKPHTVYNENHYKYILPEVFVEEYLGDNINDFKFFCFSGIVKYFHIDSNRYSDHCQNYYDKKFNLLKFTNKHKQCDFHLKPPKNLKLLISIAEKLSKPFDFVRVDLFNINNKVYFSELTFCPDAGNIQINSISYDYKIGSYWK